MPTTKATEPHPKTHERRRHMIWFLLLRVPELTLAALLAVLVIFMTIAVISRYALDIGIPWSDEAARLLFIWIVFVGFAVGVRHRSHIAVEWFVDRLPRSWRRTISVIQDAAILLFSIFFTWQSIVTVRFSFMQRLPGLEITIAWLYFAVVVAGLLMTVYAAANLWESSQRKSLRVEDAAKDAIAHAE